ncbi:hypothetical protein WJX72_009324 [[Myrmecia] bisecta]|uniref:Uncharacterized protein n=1 Tax=[Myrmecia] bisecta TaxID=41462 RepID=A0AAW1R8R3_9CHLO
MSRKKQGLVDSLKTPEGPEADQPDGLTVQLKPYQTQSLKRMLELEQAEGGYRAFMWLPLQNTCDERYWYSPLLKRAALDVPEASRGGFLCEEMGLGKTVETLALILANPAPPLPESGPTKTEDGLVVSRATLVVCAVSLVGQWAAETRDKLANSLRVHMYHGQARVRDAKKLASSFDLVITTYATLSSDFTKQAKAVGPSGRNLFPPLGAIKWHRVVLDESHTVKNTAVAHTKACVALQGDNRWCVTGTPINTDVNDLLGQFAALHFSPFDNKGFFSKYVKTAFSGNMYSRKGGATLLYTLSQMLIRHTKEQLTLPEKSEENIAVLFTAEEQTLYTDAHAKAKRQFDVFRSWGAPAISKRLLQIMSLLQPMRRICSGGALSEKDLTVPDLQHVLEAGAHGTSGGIGERDESLVAPEDVECTICLDSLERPVKTPCNHWFCRECISSVLNSLGNCPLCRLPLQAHQLVEGVGGRVNSAEGASTSQAAAAGPSGTSDSKLRALLRELRRMRAEDESAKALVFSQYVSTIEWLKTRLTEEGFGYRYISGSMPLKQRTKAIDAFQNDPPTTVFLLSMRSGSVGINLTAANYVFLLEPAINPALEEQAIGRSWRMGQTREVVVKRFYVKGSIEERIMEMVKQRREGNPGAYVMPEYTSTAAARRANATDLAGSLKADRQNLKQAELELLFRDPTFPPPVALSTGDDDAEEDTAASREVAFPPK